MWEHQIIMLKIHGAKTLNLGNTQINFILPLGMVTCLCRQHFQALPSSTNMPHSTWHQVQNQAPVQSKDTRVMGHCGKHMISPKEVMVDLKCSPLNNSQDRGCQLQAHFALLQHCLKTIQSFGWHVPPLLHLDNFPVHLGDPASASQWNVISWLRNCEGQMIQGLPISPHYQTFPMMNMMQIFSATIHQTWVGPKA